MKVRKNDTVLVIAGKDKGVKAKVLRTLPADHKIVVDGVNVQKRHRKARSAKETSGLVDQAGPIDVSNVLVVCPVCGKAVKVGHKFEGDKKVRICRKCKESIDAKVEVKDTKKAKKADKEVKEKKTTSKRKSKVEA